MVRVLVVCAGCGRVGFATEQGDNGDIDALISSGDADGVITDAAIGTEIVGPSMDTYLQSSGGGSNGTAPDMISGDNGTRDYFLMYRFDLAGLPPSINKAALYLVGYASGGTTPFALDVHRVTQEWQESATWSGPAPSESWTPGGAIAPAIYASTTVTPGEFGGYEWDVTALVNEWLAGTQQNFGLQLRFQPLASPATMVFGAREVSSPTRKPQLRITP